MGEWVGGEGREGWVGRMSSRRRAVDELSGSGSGSGSVERYTYKHINGEKKKIHGRAKILMGVRHVPAP